MASVRIQGGDPWWDDAPLIKLKEAPVPQSPEKTHGWQRQHAATDAKGALTWKPEVYKFAPGESVRYIDFSSGRDSADGRTRDNAWKHHPWDSQATGQAAACRGVHAYVFKRGVCYRGTLLARDSGQPGRPVQLTSDPTWGEGEAVICGSARVVSGWTRGRVHDDIPRGSNVWHTELDFAPRNIWMLNGDNVTRIPLARMPNWNVTDPEDVKQQWWSWDNPGHPYFGLTMKSDDGRQTLAMGRDTEHITGPKELYLGAIIWAEFGWVDGTPYPAFVRGFDAEKNALGFEGYLGSPTSRIICRHHRYYLEDKPHYLDDPTGEFWFEKKGGGGRLHVIFPDRERTGRCDRGSCQVCDIA